MKLADIASIIGSTRFNRILWQKLNRKFGDGGVFVMATGQKLLYSEYDINDVPEWASYKTFELVDNAIPCATNYSATGSRISIKWEQLLTQGTGPSAGPQQQVAFEKAKKVLYDKYNTKRSEFYEEYLQKERAFRKKEVQMQLEFQEKYEDEWKSHFDKEFPVTDEYMHYDAIRETVTPYLKAIDEWEQGPLASTLNPMREEFKSYLRTVTSPGVGNVLKYYDVSMIPGNWYQWFDPSQPDDDDQWDTITVDESQDDNEQHNLYKALGGSKDTSAEKDNDDDDSNNNSNHKSDLKVQLSLNVRAVQINRPWLNLDILKLNNFKIPGEQSGSWSTGELSSKNKGSFPMLSTQMIVAKDFNFTATKHSQTVNGSTDDGTFNFGAGDYTQETSYKTSVTFKGTKVIGYSCILLPKYPK